MLNRLSVWQKWARAALFGSLVLVAHVAAAQSISIDNEAGSSFKGTKRVAIAQFGVEFYTQLTAVGRSGGNTARQVSTLHGVTEPAMQAVVDKLYAETVAKLKEAGFDVVDQALLTADPQYQALVTAYGKPSPYLVHDSQGLGDGEHLSKVFAPTGMSAFYASAGSSGGYLRANMQDRLNSQNYGIASKEAEIAKRLDATLLKFSFLANYGVTKASKNGLLANFANIAGRVSLETAPVLMSHDTQVQFVDANGARVFGNIKRSGQTGAFYLDKPVQAENIFTSAEVTSDDTQKSDGAKNAMFSLFGSKNAVKNQTVEVSATDPVFSAAYAKLLASADDALIAALKNGR